MKYKPSCFEDIIAGVALYRPGPMDSIPQYLENKKHPEKIKYACPELKPILQVTYGCIVYQEQVMQIVRDLAGYSYGRADLVRRAMSKKKKDVMDAERKYFVNGKKDKDGNVEIKGCVANGISAKTANEIFDDMASFAEYAFNKSHAAAYAVITYETAYLRCYYPSEFLAAVMTGADNLDDVAMYISDAKKTDATGSDHKIKVMPPSVLKSDVSFSAGKDGNIYYGLAMIKNVSTSAAKEIVDARNNSKEITDMYSLFECLSQKNLKTNTIEALIKAGALNDIIPNIATALDMYKPTIDAVKRDKKAESNGQVSLFDLVDENEQKNLRPRCEIKDEFSKSLLLEFEKCYLGTYVSDHPLKKYNKLMEECGVSSVRDAMAKDKQPVVMAGIVTEKKVIYTKKNNKKMAFFTIEDEHGDLCQFIIFPDAFALYGKDFEEGSLVAISGKVNNSEDHGFSVIVDQIAPIEQLKNIAEDKNRYAQSKSSEYNILKIKCDKENKDQILETSRYGYKGNIPIYWYDIDSELCYKTGVSVRYDSLFNLKIKRIIGESGEVKWDTIRKG